MITDTQINAYLAQHGPEATRQWLIANHQPHHQTLDMKLMQLERVMKGALA